MINFYSFIILVLSCLATLHAAEQHSWVQPLLEDFHNDRITQNKIEKYQLHIKSRNVTTDQLENILEPYNLQISYVLDYSHIKHLIVQSNDSTLKFLFDDDKLIDLKYKKQSLKDTRA